MHLGSNENGGKVKLGANVCHNTRYTMYRQSRLSCLVGSFS